MRGRRGLVTLAVVGGIALIGCSVSAGASVDREVLEQQVSDSLEAQVGTAPKKVECPDELEPKSGATTRCTLTAPDGSEIGATVTVSEVDGDNVNFDIQVDESAS